MKMILRLLWRHLRRRPGRTLLTAGGVASALLLFVSIESLSHGLEQALEGSDAARSLVVYRKNRYCPQTSFLPERYATQIARLDGVERVLPVKVFLNNCRTSLDVVAFHGSPVDALLAGRQLELIDGDLERFRREESSALVGRDFAARRGLAPGDRFRFGDISVDVAGIVSSRDPVNEGLILTHLEFLQRAGPVSRLGTVTQFDVRIGDASRASELAREIDELFRSAEEPTDTRPRSEFLARSTRELSEQLDFGRIFGLVCLLVVLVLVANTVLMSLHERREEFGVLLTLGFGGRHLAGLVVGEALLLTLVGAALGLAGVFVLVRVWHPSIGVEGVIVPFSLSPGLFVTGLGVAAGCALVAASIPALRASRSDVQSLLRSA